MPTSIMLGQAGHGVGEFRKCSLLDSTKYVEHAMEEMELAGWLEDVSAPLSHFWGRRRSDELGFCCW
jgi:hypothetical protein